MRDNDKQLLSAWLQSHDVENSAEKLKKLETFHDFLYEWSGKINLVSSNDRELLVENHIIDSLSPIDILNNPATIIDIGSGGGFPAIPLGIICPHLNIVMVESREKKAKFLSVAIDFVDLPNLSVSRCRIEEYKPKNLLPKDKVIVE